MQLRQCKSRKSIDDQEIGLKKQSCTRKSTGQTKQKRSISKDKENLKGQQPQQSSKAKKISETFKLKDILKNKKLYNALEESSENTATRSSPQKTECQTSNSRFSNCNCNKEMMEENMHLKQEIMEHLEKIQTIVLKNERYMTHRSQQEIKTDSFLSQDRSAQKCQRRTVDYEQEDVINQSDHYNLNYIIQQQQFQITNLKTKLFCQEQKFAEKQTQYEQEVIQLKNQVVQLTSGMDMLREQIHQKQFQQQVSNKKEHSIKK